MILRSLGFRDTFDPMHPRDPGLAALFGWGATSAAGIMVTPDRALQSVAVMACVRVIAETMKQVPFVLYKKTGPNTRVVADTHPLYSVLRTQPNRFQTPAEFKEMLEAHLLLRGNGYAEIISTGGASVSELMPLHPDRVQPFWAPDGRRAYRVSDVQGGQRILLQNEMFHLMGLCFDGLRGISPIQYARNAIGLDLAQEQFAGANIANGVRPAGVLQTDKRIGEDGTKNLRKQFEEMNAGSQNAGRTMILEDGLKWEQLGLTMVDAQFLEQRKFSIEQIARLYRVPLHMIGDLDRATNNNIEQQSLEFVKFTMMPWFVTWEEAASRDLLGPTEQKTYCAEFNLDALLRSDEATRRASFTAGRQWGYLSTNDIRARMGLNPVDGGDDYWRPVNMAIVGQAPVDPTPASATTGDALSADDVKQLIQEALDAAK